MQQNIVAVLKRAQALRMSAAETKAAVLAVFGLTAASLSVGANAALDAAITTGITALEGSATDLGAAVMGAVVFVMLISLGIRLTKKMLGKAV
jgi:hypothetical protein